jgi:hypothetical protein
MRRALGEDTLDSLYRTVATDGSYIVAPGLAQATGLTSCRSACPTLALPGELWIQVHGFVTAVSHADTFEAARGASGRTRRDGGLKCGSWITRESLRKEPLGYTPGRLARRHRARKGEQRTCELNPWKTNSWMDWRLWRVQLKLKAIPRQRKEHK